MVVYLSLILPVIWFIILIMRKLFLALTFLIIPLICFGLQKQKITIIPWSSADSDLVLLLESSLLDKDTVIVYHSFISNLSSSFDPMAYMFSEKLSGVLIVSNNNILVFSTKGFLRKFVVKDNIDNIANRVSDFFPPKEPEKIIKEITEIDYISPLEEKGIRHSVSFMVGYEGYPSTRFWFKTNYGIGSYNIEFYSKDSIVPIVGLSYILDSRYFSISFGGNFSFVNPSEVWGIDLSFGFWMFKGFFFVGAYVLIEKFSLNLDSFYYLWNNQYISLKETVNIVPEKVNFLNLYVYPILKFKFSKRDILTVNPLLGFGGSLIDYDVVFDGSVNESSGPPRFLGIVFSFDFGISEKFTIRPSLKFLINTFNYSGLVKDLGNFNLYFSQDILSIVSFEIVYSF